jgi:uncharacterized coiled-coil DUF342 family protein
MAITKTIEIDVNSQGAVGGINNVTNSIEQTDKATKSLKAQLKEATLEVQKLADEFGATSKEVIEASKRAADLKDRIEDANDSILAFKGEGAFNATAKALGSVASGFSAVEGAIVLAGGQSEEFQETMLKLQGAMALAQGLEGLEDAGRSFKQLGAVAKNALAGIRTGIAATGIGVLLVALGAVVAYWDDIKEAVGGVSDEQEALNEKSQKNLDVEQKKLDSFSLQENSLRLQGKSERDILQMKVKQTNEIIKASEIQIEQSIATTKAQTETAKRNQEILAGTLKFLSLPLTMILKTVDLVGKALGKDFGLEEKVFSGLASFVFDPKEVQAEGDAAVAEQRKALAKLKSDRDGLQLSIKNIDTQAAKDAAAKQKEANDKAIELEKKRKEALEQIRLGEIDTEKERRAEELFQIQEQYRLLIEEAVKFGQDTTALKEAQRTKEKELADKFKKEDEEKELEYWIKQSEKAIERDAAAKVLSDKRIAEAQAEADAKRAIQEASFDVASQGISLVKGLFEKNKGLQKAALIAESAIGIAKMITANNAANIGALATPQAIATSGAAAAPVIALNNIKTAIGVAATIAATAKGLAALGGGGAPSSGNVGSGGGGGNAASTPTPQFNVVGNSGVNQIAATLGAQQPVQAYVVANQVTTQQALDRNIVQNASLG